MTRSRGLQALAALGAALLLVAPGVASADPAEQLVRQLQPALREVAARGASVTLAPLNGAGTDARTAEVAAAFARKLAAVPGLVVLDKQALAKVLDEAALASADGAAFQDMAAAMGAAAIVTGELAKRGADYDASVRLVAVEDGRVLGAASVRFSAGGDEASAEAAGLQVALRRLADRVAQGLDGMNGDVRYQRFAILPFEEGGQGAKDRQLGLLVASELTTTLARDHRMLVVERSQISKVMDEMALGQSGVVDESKTVEMGKLLGAQGLVVGTVSEAGDRYLVNARIVSAETGQLLAAEDASLPAADLIALSSDAVVLRTTSGAVYRSILLPGWGQFYNRQTVKGVAFIGAELAGAGLAAASHILGSKKQEEYRDLPPGTPLSEFEAVRQDAEGKLAWRNRFIWITVAVHAIGVLDAFLSGETYEAPGGGS